MPKANDPVVFDNDVVPYPVKTTDDMMFIFHQDKGIMVSEDGDEYFHKFDPEQWPDCDDSAYFAALADVLAYVIEVAASRGIYNVPNVRRAYRIVDVIRTWEKAIFDNKGTTT